MHAHVSLHLDRNHDGLVSRVAREVGVALDWISGPALSDQQYLERARAEARNERHGYGVL